MAKIIVKLTFPQKLIKEPLTFQMAKKYNIVPNIRRAKVTETVGELILELSGKKEGLDRGINFLKKKGIIVEPVVGDIVE